MKYLTLNNDNSINNEFVCAFGKFCLANKLHFPMRSISINRYPRLATYFRLFRSQLISFIFIFILFRTIVYLFVAQQGLNITINADKTLYNFCKWQQKMNPVDDSHPNHHDVAILVTREDICSRANTPCSTLGVAHVAGMCQPDRSCSVNEDNGITLAHTITHELGHK